MNTAASDSRPLSPAEFDVLFPFHVGFGRDGVVAEVGRSMRKLSPAVRPGTNFADVFDPKRPDEPFDFDRLAALPGRLRTLCERSRGTILRGQFLVHGERIFFLGSPWFATMAELVATGLTLDDFAAHDPTLDLLQLLELQKVVTDDLHSLTERLKAKSAQAAEAARSKDVFLASISHELRTPLTGILGMSEILAEQVHGPLNEKQQRDIHIVQTSGRNLLRLINDVIDYAKAGTGQAEIHRQPCAIETFCTPALDRVRPVAEKRGQRVTFDNHAPGALVNADARRMTETLANLLGNATKFSPEGGECGLRASLAPGEVRLEVWDRGIGIEPENIPKLFQPFQQLDGRLARRYEGTGLGLALVKQWVDLHGGQIEVASERGAGSRFTVVLPASVAPRQPED